MVNHSGIIEANRLTKTAKGEIVLLADMEQGTANINGVAYTFYTHETHSAQRNGSVYTFSKLVVKRNFCE